MTSNESGEGQCALVCTQARKKEASFGWLTTRIQPECEPGLLTQAVLGVQDPLAPVEDPLDPLQIGNMA